MKLNHFLSFFLACFAGVISSFSFAQDGQLDSTFGLGGKVLTGIGTFDDPSYAVANQIDGKIIVAGQSYTETNYDFSIIRYKNDGSIDTSFGNNGIALVSFGSYDDKARAVAIQTDGKIVVAGYSSNGLKDNFAIARLNTDGTLDNSFGENGKVITSIGSVSDNIKAIALQANGDIVVAGFTSINSTLDFAVARYIKNGDLDLSFDVDGIVTTSFGSGNDFASSLAIQADGKIVVAGTSFITTNDDFAVARYNTNGSLDPTFDGDGKLTTSITGTFNESGNSVVIQNDQKIIVAGNSNNSFNDFIVIRYNSDGSVDETFGSYGKAITDFGVSIDFGQAIDLLLQPDEKIIAGGLKSDGNKNDFALVRYNKNGSIDSTFGENGIVSTNFGEGFDDVANCISMQADGKILAVGQSHNGNQNFTAIARYNNSVSPVAEINDVRTAEFKVYPNPFSNSATIQLKNLMQNASLSIYNSFNQLVYNRDNINGNSVEFNRNNLPKGVYFLKIEQENVVKFATELVIID